MPAMEESRTPGQLLAALLEERGWSQRALGVVIGVSETVVNRLISDKRRFDAELALTLGELFDIEPKRFLELQQTHDLALARLSARPDPARANRARLFGDLPIGEMIKRGWLAAEDVRDVATVQTELIRFFGVGSLEEIEVLPHAAKKTNLAAPATPTQVAWLTRVKQIAESMMVGRYSPATVEAAILKLSDLRHAPEEARKVSRILTENGIRFVIVESLPSAKIDGVCFWLDNRSPVVGLSLRHDRIDNFWFVLRHELEHVRRLHGLSAVMLDTELEGTRARPGGDIPEEERQANEAAEEFCVPKKAMDAFVSRKYPVFVERDILGFSRTIGVHPGLIAGQLQHVLNRFDLFRPHLVKIRSCVTPGSMVDGWGTVAPLAI